MQTAVADITGLHHRLPSHRLLDIEIPLLGVDALIGLEERCIAGDRAEGTDSGKGEAYQVGNLLAGEARGLLGDVVRNVLRHGRIQACEEETKAGADYRAAVAKGRISDPEARSQVHFRGLKQPRADRFQLARR